MLVIAGDVSPEEVRAADRRRPTARCRRSSRSPRARGRRSRRRRPAAPLTLADPRVAQPSAAPRVSRAVAVERQAAASPKRSRCSAFILGHGNTSRLYRALVEERGISVGAGGCLQRQRARSLAVRRLRAPPKPGVTLPQLEEAIDGVIDELLAKGVHRRRGRALDKPPRCRSGLRPGQPGHHGCAGTARR